MVKKIMFNRTKCRFSIYSFAWWRFVVEWTSFLLIIHYHFWAEIFFRMNGFKNQSDSCWKV
jgi:hypothetical protein